MPPWPHVAMEPLIWGLNQFSNQNVYYVTSHRFVGHIYTLNSILTLPLHTDLWWATRGINNLSVNHQSVLGLYFWPFLNYGHRSVHAGLFGSRDRIHRSFQPQNVLSQLVKGGRWNHLTKFSPTSQHRKAVASLQRQLHFCIRSEAMAVRCSIHASVNSAKQCHMLGCTSGHLQHSHNPNDL